MRKIILILFAVVGLLFLTGCPNKPMTNNEIIAEVEKCRDAGLYPRLYQDYRMRIVLVNCETQ